MATFEDYRQFCLIHGANYTLWKQDTTEQAYKIFKKEEIKKYRKEINNIISKRYRIKKKLEKWKEIFFITLTFDNKNINKSKRTIYDKIRKIFYGSNFIATEDYGKNTHRLHYHILTDKDIDLSNWKYGYTCKLKVNNKIEDKKRLSSYITKLANHNLKKGITKTFYGNAKKEKNI